MVDVETAILTARESRVALLPFAVLALGLSALETDEAPAVGIARGQRFLAGAAESAAGLAGSVFTLAAGLLVAPESLGVVLEGEGDPTPEALVRVLHGAAEEAAQLVAAGRIEANEVADLFGGVEALAREAMAPDAALDAPPESVKHVLSLMTQLREVSAGFTA